MVLTMISGGTRSLGDILFSAPAQQATCDPKRWPMGTAASRRDETFGKPLLEEAHYCKT